MIIIKKLSVFLVFIMFTAALTGCARPIDPEQASPFSVYRIKDKMRFTLGDKREDIERVMEDAPLGILEYEEDTPEDQIFEIADYGYISFGYDRAGNTLRLRLYDDKWQIANGLKVTDSVEDVHRKYQEKQIFTYKQNNDIYVSYDEDGNLIDFDGKSPYLVRFLVKNNAILEIVVYKNLNPVF